MFKGRTITSLVVLTLSLMTNVQHVAARREVNPSYSYNPASVIRSQVVAASLLNVPVAPDTLPHAECVDFPYEAVASVYACSDPSQTTTPEWWNQAAIASITLNAYAISNPSPLLKCTNMPFGAVASVHACPDPSQIPLPEWLIMGGQAPNQ
jgi:hypothetical protein